MMMLFVGHNLRIHVDIVGLFLPQKRSPNFLFEEEEAFSG